MANTACSKIGIHLIGKLTAVAQQKRSGKAEGVLREDRIDLFQNLIADYRRKVFTGDFLGSCDAHLIFGVGKQENAISLVIGRRFFAAICRITQTKCAGHLIAGLQWYVLIEIESYPVSFTGQDGFSVGCYAVICLVVVIGYFDLGLHGLAVIVACIGTRFQKTGLIMT